MKLSTLFAFTLLFLSIFAVTTVKGQSGTLFTVNDVADTHDANVGDTFCADTNGKCTLRAAIEESNATVVQDAVNFALPNPSTINLTLGELSVSTNIYIIGPGARKLTVQRSPAAETPQFRVFRIKPSNSFLPSTTIRGMTIRNGSSSGDGGAIYTEYQSNLFLKDVTLTNNTAAGSGGAIFSAGTFNLSRSLVIANTANGLYGGGIININQSGNSVITNSTLTNNSGSQGGAIYNSGNLILANNTLSHNSASVAGSSVANGSTGTVNVLNTIIGLDTTVSSLSGAFTSFGNNLITDARNSTGFTNGANGDQVSDNNAINPLLGDLANNGGETDTRALLNSSPAIDHGNGCVFNRNCPQPLQNIRLFSDQRENRLRSSGTTVDIGAFEVGNFSFGGRGILGFLSRPRQFGSLVVTTRAATNEKQYRIVSSTGGATIDNLVSRDVYIIEIKSKRAGQSSLLIWDPDGSIFILPINSVIEQDGIKLTWKE